MIVIYPFHQMSPLRAIITRAMARITQMIPTRTQGRYSVICAHMSVDWGQAYPLLNQLPLDANPPKQLASGPFAAYKALGDLDVFRAVRTGIDRTKLLLLSGVPTITDDSGNSVTVSRWRLESEDRVITLKVGDDLKIDSFVGTVVDIDDDFVALRQSNGLLWVVLLGRSLGDAIAIPPNLF